MKQLILCIQELQPRWDTMIIREPSLMICFTESESKYGINSFIKANSKKEDDMDGALFITRTVGFII